MKKNIIASRYSSPNQNKQSTATNSLQADKKQIQQRQLQQSVRERRRLRAAEYCAEKPVKDHLQSRGELVGRRIADLQSKLKTDK